ncbi:MAG TPA: phosphotransferase [Phenylobacterium sp.]|uniref:phosphotransferase n=1 Tax=Phenylobacterium sp. TaxID=1871053 RepID=UPI002C472832|nr:phosphotransferase [Phenylobacterium sp.]
MTAYAPLPADRRPAIEHALSTAFGTADLDGVVRLTGGLSGAGIFRIRVGGVAYLLRIEGARDVFRDPHRGYACLRIAAEACLSPRVWFADPVEGIAILDFVAEQPFIGDRSARLTELAQSVRILHQTPGFPPLMDYLDGLLAVTAPFRPLPVLAQVFARMDETLAAYRALPADVVSSHNDLNPRNVLFDGRRQWLVDWESAFACDRYVDLAALANLWTGDETEVAQMLGVYFNRPPTGAERARLSLMRRLNHVFYGAMFLGGVLAEQPHALPRDLEAPDVRTLHRRMAEGAFALDPVAGRLTYAKAQFAAALQDY